MFHSMLPRSFVLRPFQQQTRNISIRIPQRAKGATVEQHLRSILHVPPEFKILFLSAPQGTIPSIVKENFDIKDKAPSFVNSGYFSNELIQGLEDIDVAASLDKTQQKLQVPSPDKWEFSPENSSFLHFTSLEPHEGLEYLRDPKLPKTEKKSPPIIANMTHSIFTRQIDFQNYTCVYSILSKIGSAPGKASALILVREDQLHTGPRKEIDFRSLVPIDSPHVPSATQYGNILNYLKKFIESESIEGIESRLNQKSSQIYSFLDNSTLFVNNVAPESRSRSKISFSLKNPNKQLEQALFDAYTKAIETHPALLISKYGFLIDLAPHVGPTKVDALLDLLNNFEKKGGI